ncbi:MAG: DUF3618 domain-containing protein [Motilibacteraceae bacterium]
MTTPYGNETYGDPAGYSSSGVQTAGYGTGTSGVVDPNDPEALRAQIERTRAELSGDVDQLADRVTPSHIVQRKVDRTRGRLGGMKDKIMGSAHHATQSTSGSMSSATGSASDQLHSAAGSAQQVAGQAQQALHEAPHKAIQQTQGSPLIAGAVAFGVGYLVSALLPASEAEQHVAEQAKDKVQPVAQQAKQELTQTAKESAQHLKEPAQQAVEQVKGTATDATEQVKGQAKGETVDLREETKQTAQQKAQQARQ